MTNNPVEYIFVSRPNQYDEECGITTSGWYFADETWSYYYGPYEDEEAAKQACIEYAKQL